MRWHVHGTDSATGQPVVLGVNEPEAAHAVQSAMSKRILVSHVVRGGLMGLANRETIKRAGAPLLAAAVLVLLPIAGGLYYAHRVMSRDLRGSQGEQTQLAVSLKQSESLLREAQGQIAELQAASTGTTKQLLAELETARRTAAERQTQLNAAQTALEKDATATAAMRGDLETAKKSLADAQGRVKTLDTQVKDQRTKLAALDDTQKKMQAAQARATKLETNNAELAKLVEQLKAQTLELAVNSAASTKPEIPVTSADVPARSLWALRTGYDAASDFLVFYFGKDSTTTAKGTGGAGGLTSITATLPDNACTLQLQTDKQRVYAAALVASFAADAPKDKLAENAQIFGKFAQTFAPGWKDADAWLAGGMKALAGKVSSERLVLIGDDFKATLWNNKMGMFTLRIESPRGELDE